ncbi:hypothetical protein LZZ85_00460 [Terrimonas sp. NA20]|uniref:Bacteriocin n=1 Tax=Terrimonas ginsenosidimutans TaxID=2908004 RepID=A0ABS9KK74_9BACT|nr:hypothetical protein [Terrimonas ginsenosidimutans]MCG2612722.1 hypothetical protein [Terrimonas ginsenosidimutans]
MKRLKVAGKSLTKSEQKMIGGGVEAANCCAHTANWTTYQCGYSSASEAQNAATTFVLEGGGRAWYCCNCASSPGYPGVQP